MGPVYITCAIGPNRESLTAVEFVLDYNEIHTVVSPALGAELGLDFGITAPVRVNGVELQASMALACVRMSDRDGVTLVVAVETPVPRLARMAFQGLGLRFNREDRTIDFGGIYPPPVFVATVPAG